jgi:hypothetical protein
MHVSDVVDDNQEILPVSNYRNFRVIDLTKTGCSLESRDIFRMIDPNDQVQYFNSLIVSVFQEHGSLKRCSQKNADNSWMIFKISRLIVDQNIAFNILDVKKTDENRYSIKW